MAKRQRTQRSQISAAHGSWFLALLLALVAVPFFLSAVAQPPLPPAIRVERALIAPGERIKAGDAEADANSEKISKEFEGGAPLKTDPEQQRLLKRAEICVAEGRYDLATVLWQKVLDEAGDTLMTRDGRFFTSLSEEVERTIVSLPPVALRTYRLAADGQAELIISKGAGVQEEAALAEVVRRYFLSSSGDDAAYKLACLALDRHDFVGAGRLLSKIIEQHPDPSMPKSEVLIRLGVASARMGDGAAAKKWLVQSATVAGDKPNSEVYDLVIADAAQATQQAVAAGSASENWPMLLGSTSRTGHMRQLPSQATAATLTEAFVYQFSLAASDNMTQNPWGGMMGAFGLHGRPYKPPVGREISVIPRDPLVNAWRNNRWMPTAQLLFDKDLVIVKGADELVAFKSTAVESVPKWRTFRKNEYNLDGQTADLSRMQMQGVPGGAQTEPRSVGEVFLFGDRVHQSMSLHNGIVYTLEGKPFDADSPPTPGLSLAGKPFQWNVTPRRTRSNFLAAYHASSGKWAGRRAASDEDKEGSQDVGFLGAPVGFGNLLLVPVTDGGTIWLYALEEARSKTGDNFMPTVWKCYLCDEPSKGCNPWATIVPALDGRDLYLTCGTGVVFAVDAVSGTVRWATRYQRKGSPDQRMRNYGNMQNREIFREWEDDVVVPHGKALIVTASDAKTIFALDRRTGDLLWDSPRGELPTTDSFAASYVLGVKGENIYLAGKNIVRCLRIAGGLRVWEKEIEDSFGHGALTADALYVPVKDSILKLDLETGEDLGQVGVRLPTEDPVGNIYSDGQKLWVAGAGRVYAMTTLEHRLEILAQQISKGDPEAQLTRMRLMFKEMADANRELSRTKDLIERARKDKDEEQIKKFQEQLAERHKVRDVKLELTLNDLRGAYQLFRQKLPPDESASRLFLAMHELKLPQENPLVALGLLNELFIQNSPPPISAELKAKRSELVLNSVRNARQQKLQNLTPALLQVATLLDNDHLIHSAAAAIQATAIPEDRELLTAAVTGTQPIAQAIAIGGLAKIAGAEAKDSLTKVIGTGDERVKLAAARALANLDQRESLPTFVELLNAQNPRTRLRAHQALRALSGQQITFSPEGKPEERAKSVDLWKKWVEGSGQTAKLTLPLPENDLPLGRTLFVSYGQSTVVELDSDKKERWRARVMNPWCCQGLPNGNRLIAGFAQGQNSVVEYNEEGKEIWRKDRLPGIPYSVQRLDNGNTLVACKDQQQVIEILPNGELKSVQVQGHPMYAQRLENGNTLIALQQSSKVIEMDAKNEQVWEVRNMNGPCYCQRLDNGNTLIVQMHTGQVVEVDPTSKQVWTSRVPLVNPMCAQRLPNGNTLIADNNGVTEVDAAGQQVKWRHAQNNVTGVSHF